MSYNFLTNKEGDILCPVAYADKLKLDGTPVSDLIMKYITEIQDSVYPVGSLYFDTTGSDPRDLLGFGTWEQEASGRTIIGAGDGVDRHDCIEKTLADGTRWIRIFYQSDVFPSKEAVEQGYTSDTCFSRMNYLAEYYAPNGDIEFLLEYPDISGRWRQRGNPFYEQYNPTLAKTRVEGYLDVDPIDPSNTDVEFGLYVPWSSSTTWGGLAHCANDAARITGNVRTRTSYHYPIGQITLYSGTGNTLIGATSSDLPGTGAQAVSSIALWVRIDNVSGNYHLLETGGEASHTLDVSKLPNHYHSLYRVASSKGTGANEAGGGSALSSYYTAPTGGSAPHNNMQPYQVVNIWKRIS